MKLKLHRTVRTPSSEEIYIYDLDTNDEAGEPMDIGKMDVHYTNDQIVGTMLFWKDWAEGSGSDGAAVSTIVDTVLEELSEPLGVSAEYDMEYYICDRDSRQFVSNIDDEDFDFEEDEEDYEEYEEDEGMDEEEGDAPAAPANADIAPDSGSDATPRG